MEDKFRYRFRVKFDNVDYAQVLYFPRQIDFYVEALEEFCLERLGISFRKMLDEDRIGWPTVRFEVDYRHPLRFEEQAEVEVSVVRLGERSVTFGYRVYRIPDGLLTSRATQVVSMVRLDNWQSCPVPDDYRRLLEPHLDPQAADAGGRQE